MKVDPAPRLVRHGSVDRGCPATQRHRAEVAQAPASRRDGPVSSQAAGACQLQAVGSGDRASTQVCGAAEYCLIAVAEGNGTVPDVERPAEVESVGACQVPQDQA